MKFVKEDMVIEIEKETNLYSKIGIRENKPELTEPAHMWAVYPNFKARYGRGMMNGLTLDDCGFVTFTAALRREGFELQ